MKKKTITIEQAVSDTDTRFVVRVIDPAPLLKRLKTTANVWTQFYTWLASIVGPEERNDYHERTVVGDEVMDALIKAQRAYIKHVHPKITKAQLEQALWWSYGNASPQEHPLTGSRRSKATLSGAMVLFYTNSQPASPRPAWLDKIVQKTAQPVMPPKSHLN